MVSDFWGTQVIGFSKIEYCYAEIDITIEDNRLLGRYVKNCPKKSKILYGQLLTSSPCTSIFESLESDQTVIELR